MTDEWAKLPDVLDNQYYEELDPFFYFSTIETLAQGSLPDMKMEFPDGTTTESHVVFEKLKKSGERQLNYIKSLRRVFRYFSSETLILLILSGGPFGPFIRISSVVKFAKLNAVFASVARREVPSDYELKIDGEPLDFVSWVSFLIFGQRDWIVSQGQGVLVELIVEEASMLISRGAVNAFKHGKPFSYGKGAVMKFSDPNGGAVAVNKQLEGINWVDWREQRDGSIEFSHNTEEIIPDEDRKRLFSVALLIDAIRDIRLAKYDGNEKLEVTLPCNIETGLNVKRQNITIKLTPQNTK